MDEKKIDKKLGVLIIAVAVLIVSVTGSTFAYFALSVSTNTDQQITGETAAGGSGALSLTVTPSTLGGTSSGATKSNKYVPQLAGALNTAIGDNYKCVDANGNTVCSVYTITIQNTGTAQVVVNGTINFTSYNPTNVRWKRIQSASSVGTVAGGAGAAAGILAANQDNDLTTGTQCTAAVATGCTDVTLAANASETYYIVVWLDEISEDQSSVDAAKTFTANVTFNAKGGGKLTSTITF